MTKETCNPPCGRRHLTSERSERAAPASGGSSGRPAAAKKKRVHGVHLQRGFSVTSVFPRVTRVFPGIAALAAVLCFISPPALHAQLGLYGAFTTAKLNQPGFSSNWTTGGTFGAYLASNRLAFFNVGLDGRGTFTSGGGASFDSGSVGPRVALNTHVLPFHPYVEATLGVGHASFTGHGPYSVTKFEYQFLGGVDWTILPRIDWRVAEFSYGGLAGLNNGFHPETISTGIVVRIPFL